MTFTLPSRTRSENPVPASAELARQTSARSWTGEPLSAADPETFQAALFGVVQEEMDRVNSVNALDEWHLGYLDERIDSEVLQEQIRLTSQATARRTSLESERVALGARIDQLAARVESASSRLEAAHDELTLAAHNLATAEGSPAQLGGHPANPAALARIVEDLEHAAGRRGIRRVLRRPGVTSPADLFAKLETVQRSVSELERRIAAQQLVVDAATAARVAAHDRFRGVATTPAAPSSTPSTLAGDQPSMSASTMGEEAA